MMYHFFFQYWDLRYSPQSTKVLLEYVVMYVKIYIWAKWDLGTLGGSIRFCKFTQILSQIGWILLTGTACYKI